jgi:hypothetical protein
MGISVFPAAGGGVTPKTSIFTSTGTFTAPSGTQYVEVFLVGGGGGGGAAQRSANQCAGGGGGGGGVVNWRKLSVTPGTSYTVTVGAGGSGATGAAAGAVGADTTFGSLATAWGGGGGGTRIDSTNYQPSARATIGGAGSSTVPVGSGGSGAAQSLGYGRYNSTTALATVNADFSSLGGVLTGNWSNTQFNLGGEIPGGYGIDGFGGGGHGGGDSGAPTNYKRVSVAGGGLIGTFDGNNNASGTAGTTNTGGGGGGGTMNTGVATVMTGGNGGSGYAIIVYWS